MVSSRTSFPSPDEMGRRRQAAQHLRARYLGELMSGVRSRIASQGRSVRAVEASLAVTLVAIGVFWATLIGSPKMTEAGTSASPQIEAEKLTLTTHDLPSFDDKYDRHTGVLDVLRP